MYRYLAHRHKLKMPSGCGLLRERACMTALKFLSDVCSLTADNRLRYPCARWSVTSTSAGDLKPRNLNSEHSCFSISGLSMSEVKMSLQTCIEAKDVAEDLNFRQKVV